MGQREVAAWQARLESTFGGKGMRGALWADVPSKEVAYGQHVRSTALGYLVLTNSFQSFLYDTLHACTNQYRTPNSTRSAPYQPLFFLECLTLFRSCRAAESLLYEGYPLDAFSLLRDMRDRSLLLGAWTKGLTNYKALHATHVLSETRGLDRDEVVDQVRKARENEERQVMGLMTGKNSDLSAETIRWLRQWTSIFNLQVHGSHLTTASEFGDWVRKVGPLSIGPVPQEKSITLYINSSPEVHWLILRVLPFLQLSPGAFGTSWAAKWQVLDESFNFYQAGFEALGKPMGTAVRRLIEEKFTLTPVHCYVEYSPDNDTA